MKRERTSTEQSPKPKKDSRRLLLRATLLFVGIGTALGVVGYLLRPHISHHQLEQWVRHAGAWGPLALLGVQAGQIVAAPIPGVFVPLVAGMLYGPLWGSVLTGIGTVIGSAAAFWIGRGAGRRVAERWIGAEALDQAQMAIRGKRWLALIPLFLFPFSPADALCFVSGIAGIGWGPFLAAVALGRIPKDVVIAVGAAMGWSFLGRHG
jgi:uncharacterized membrane protein YdjX (TVP38/TMEM64 family)